MASVSASWAVLNPAAARSTHPSIRSRFVKVKKHPVPATAVPPAGSPLPPKRKKFKRDPFKFSAPANVWTEQKEFQRTVTTLMWTAGWPTAPRPPPPGIDECEADKNQRRHHEAPISSLLFLLGESSLSSSSSSSSSASSPPIPIALSLLAKRMDQLLWIMRCSADPATVSRMPKRQQELSVPTSCDPAPAAAAAAAADEEEDDKSYFRAGANEAAVAFLAMELAGVPSPTSQSYLEQHQPQQHDTACCWETMAETPQQPDEQPQDVDGRVDPILELPSRLQKMLFLLAVKARGRFLLPPLRVLLWWWICRTDSQQQLEFAGALRQHMTRTILLQRRDCPVAASELARGDALCARNDSVKLWLAIRESQLHSRIVVGGLSGLDNLCLNDSIEGVLAHAQDCFGGEDLYSCLRPAETAAQREKVARFPLFKGIISSSVSCLGAAWTLPHLSGRVLEALASEVEEKDLPESDVLDLLEMVLVFGDRYVTAAERAQQTQQHRGAGGGDDPAVARGAAEAEQFVLRRVKLVVALSNRISESLSVAAENDRSHALQQQQASTVRRVIDVFHQSFKSMLTGKLKNLILSHPAVRRVLDEVFQFILRHGQISREEAADVGNNKDRSVLTMDVVFFTHFLFVATSVKSDLAEKFLTQQFLSRRSSNIPPEIPIDEGEEEEEFLLSLDQEQQQQQQRRISSSRSSSITPCHFFRTNDVHIWSSLAHAMLQIPRVLAVPAILEAVVQNGAALADLARNPSGTSKLGLRSLGLLCRLVGVLYKQQQQQHRSPEIIDNLVKIIDDALLEMCYVANETIRHRSESRLDHDAQNAMGSPLRRNAPPLHCADILFFLGSFADWPHSAHKLHFQVLEPLARDAIGHPSTKMSLVVSAMLQFVDTFERRAAERLKQAEEEQASLDERIQEDAAGSEEGKTATGAEHSNHLQPNNSPVFLSDNLLLQILTARLIPMDPSRDIKTGRLLSAAASAAGHFSVCRMFKSEELLPLVRFLVLAHQSGCVASSSSSTSSAAAGAAVFASRVEEVLVANNTAQRTDLSDLIELCVLGFRLSLPTDGPWAMSVLDRFRESALAMSLEQIPLAARICRVMMGKGIFAAESDLSEMMKNRAVELVKQF